MRAVMTKKPWEETFFTGTWADELHDGETVLTSVWVITEGTGLTLGTTGATQPQLESPLVTVWTLQGGRAGVTYEVANRITTSLGRKLEGGFGLKVTD
jgi:hypothetical protein